jgi:Domain of unknown function (DUF4136)
MAKLLKTLCGLLILAAPTIVTAQKVTIEFDESRDFSQYKTFHILDGQLNSKNPSLNNDLVRKQIENDIRKRLTEKGLTEADGPHDLNVRYSLGSARRTEVEAYPAGWRGLGTRRVAVHYSEGTLIFDLRDTKSRQLVWRAIAIEDKSDPMKLVGKLDDMVKKSADKYPPKKK